MAALRRELMFSELLGVMGDGDADPPPSPSVVTIVFILETAPFISLSSRSLSPPFGLGTSSCPMSARLDSRESSRGDLDMSADRSMTRVISLDTLGESMDRERRR